VTSGEPPGAAGTDASAASAAGSGAEGANGGEREAEDAALAGATLDRAAFVDAVSGRESPVVAHVAFELSAAPAPLSAYAALADRSPYGFLLESAEKTPSSDPEGAFAPGEATDRHARFSFVGYDPEAVVTVTEGRADVETLGGPAARYVADALADADADGDDTLDALRRALPALDRVGFAERDRQALEGGLVGFLAYDAVYDLHLAEVGLDRPETGTPDAEFVLTTRTLAFDHAADDVRLVCTPVVEPGADPGAVYDDLRREAAAVGAELADASPPPLRRFERVAEAPGPRDDYEAAVRRAKEHVLDGEVYQEVVSRTRVVEGEMDAASLYAALRDVNPSPYMYLLRHGDRFVVGASPETLVSVQGDRVVANPIAGTCPRGTSPVEDRRLAGEMLADGKERAEHTMLVDLARNDVRRVSEPGSVRVEEFMNVLKYSHVQHIESTVTGRLAAAADAFDATRATFPAGTLTGAPKVRAMELLHELEREPRGVYGGGVGYYSWTGDADFAIVIRTATVERGAGEAGRDRVTVRAGAGIVADSVPAREYDETEQKMGGVLAAVERLERLDAGGTAGTTPAGTPGEPGASGAGEEGER
jgi:anthranilate synthase component 1